MILYFVFFFILLSLILNCNDNIKYMLATINENFGEHYHYYDSVFVPHQD